MSNLVLHLQRRITHPTLLRALTRPQTCLACHSLGVLWDGQNDSTLPHKLFKHASQFTPVCSVVECALLTTGALAVLRQESPNGNSTIQLLRAIAFQLGVLGTSLPRTLQDKLLKELEKRDFMASASLLHWIALQSHPLNIRLNLFGRKQIDAATTIHQKTLDTLDHASLHWGLFYLRSTLGRETAEEYDAFLEYCLSRIVVPLDQPSGKRDASFLDSEEKQLVQAQWANHYHTAYKTGSLSFAIRGELLEGLQTLSGRNLLYVIAALSYTGHPMDDVIKELERALNLPYTLETMEEIIIASIVLGAQPQQVPSSLISQLCEVLHRLCESDPYAILHLVKQPLIVRNGDMARQLASHLLRVAPLLPADLVSSAVSKLVLVSEEESDDNDPTQVVQRFSELLPDMILRDASALKPSALCRVLNGLVTLGTSTHAVELVWTRCMVSSVLSETSESSLVLFEDLLSAYQAASSLEMGGPQFLLKLQKALIARLNEQPHTNPLDVFVLLPQHSSAFLELLPRVIAGIPQATHHELLTLSNFIQQALSQNHSVHPDVATAFIQRVSASVNADEGLSENELLPVLVPLSALAIASSSKTTCDCAAITEWIVSDEVSLKSLAVSKPEAIVHVLNALPSLGLANPDFTQPLVIALSHQPISTSLIVVACSAMENANVVQSPELHILADSILDRVDDFDNVQDIVRLLYSLGSMHLAHRGVFNVLASRLEHRPLFLALSPTDAAMALFAFSTVRYINESLIAGLCQIITNHSGELDAHWTALSIRAHSTLSMHNDALYNDLCDQLVTLSSTETLNLTPSLTLLVTEGLADAGVPRRDTLDTLLDNLELAKLNALDTSRLFVSLTTLEYNDDRMRAIADQLVTQMIDVPEPFVPKIAAGLQRLHWRCGPLLKALGDRAVELSSTEDLSAESARVLLDTFCIFTHHHTAARTFLSDSARSVSRITVTQDIDDLMVDTRRLTG